MSNITNMLTCIKPIGMFIKPIGIFIKLSNMNRTHIYIYISIHKVYFIND